MHFIHIGSGTEYGKIASPHDEMKSGNPKNVYSKSKLKITNLLLKMYSMSKFPGTILRFYLVYGPYQDFNRIIPITIKNCFKNRKFGTTSGEQKRDFLYIDDAVNAIFKCLENKKTYGEIINIGFGKSYKVKNIINKIQLKLKSGKPEFGKIKIRNYETFDYCKN